MTGCRSEQLARLGARRIARLVQRAGYAEKTRFIRFRIDNVMCTTQVPFRIDLDALARDTPANIAYVLAALVVLTWLD